MLNQQYELARVQEAKDIPTVNVVDAAKNARKEVVSPARTRDCNLHDVSAERGGGVDSAFESLAACTCR